MKDMAKRYEMSDLGFLHHFLGLEIYQQVDGVPVCNNTMLKLGTVLKKYNNFCCKTMATPLAWIAKFMKEDWGRKKNNTLYRSKIASSSMLQPLSRILCLLQVYWQDLCKISFIFTLEQHKKKLAYGIKHWRGPSGQKLKLVSGYCDSDCPDSKDGMERGTTGYAFHLVLGHFLGNKRSKK